MPHINIRCFLLVLFHGFCILGALGLVLRRVAPDRVAVAPEELCRLLEADILAKVHQALQETSQTDDHTTDNAEAADRKESRPNPDKGMEKDFEKTLKSPTEQKDPSSDEGEK